jgi:RHS repeat-associated protein
MHTNVHFGGKLIWAEGAAAVTDRLGSVVSGNRKYFPYGEEPTTTAQDKTKFATYYRDATTALDYADQRYYARTIGRFLTPDPHWGGARRTAPQSWNRYTYVLGDPTNYADPTGLTVYPWLDPGIVDGYNGTIDLSDYVASGGDLEEWADAWWDSHIPDPENGSPPTLPNPGQQSTPQPAPEPRVPMYLKIIWDCYRPNGTQFTVGYTRVIRYQVVDQNGLAFAGSSVPTVKEEVVTTSGPTIVGGGVWSREDNSITPNGQFVDFYSANGNDPSTANQSFTATTSDGATYSLIVQFPGDPRVLNNYYSKTEVKVHRTSTSTVCGDAHQGSW